MTVDAELVLPVGMNGDPAGCDDCAERVAASLRQLPGVAAVQVESEPSRLRFTYETTRVTSRDIDELVERELAGLERRYVHQVLAIEGMDCADCALTLERGVGRLAGVERASVNFGAARMTLEFDSGVVGLPAIQRRVRDLGYAVSEPDAAPRSERSALWRFLTRRATLITLASGLLTLLGGIGALAGAPPALPVVAWAAAVATGGLPLLRKGLAALRTTRALDINLLMSLAVIGAAFIGDWLEAATVVFLFSLGESLEGYAMDRVRRSVRSLLSLAPSVALVKRGADELPVPVADVVPGELVVVRAGERVPLDGVVTAGMSSVDQSSLTGESMPVPREPGDPLFAGTLNGAGPLTMRVTRLAGDSSVARVIRMVETAQAQRAPVQQLVDRFARVYTPVVIAGAVVVATVPPLFGASWTEWLYRALVLLVISCPCALVLSTPISIVSALSAAARHGILIKGGAALERAARIDTLAFDKTGTLTAGQPRVVSVAPLGGADEAGALRLAATLERHSEHPLGRAIVDAAVERGLTVGGALRERVVPGAGLVAEVDGVERQVGAARLFEPEVLTSDVLAAIEDVERRGGTAVLVGESNRVDGVIGLADTPRVEARAALDDLRRAGIDDFVILSGDSVRAVAHVAAHVGVTDARSGLLPEEKLAAIHDLRRAGRVVAMVGDGVNDAPSLAAADLGIAMGVAGTDAAVETADIALMGDDLGGLASTIRLGKRARRIIAANIALSLATKGVFLTLAVTGHATLWMAIAADMGTSLLVIANGMRLLRRPDAA
ncbi:MAG TPA: heavy metal translocating P-type ATPase [Thermomicrobiales bacterium]|nr:heavy metal translocating P-type ATPase [Thermomicrobiales bacterium]